jgi:hypothetical protein
MGVTFRQPVGVEWLSIRDIGSQGPDFALQRTTHRKITGVIGWMGDDDAGRTVAAEQIAADDKFLFDGLRLGQGRAVTGRIGDGAAAHNHGRRYQSQGSQIGAP